MLGAPGDVISENAPFKVTPQSLGAAENTKFVHAACGRSHTLLVGSEGQVWSSGANNMGQVSLCEEFPCATKCDNTRYWYSAGILSALRSQSSG